MRRGRSLWLRHLVVLRNELYVEDKLCLGGDDRGTARFAVGQLIWNEQAALSSNVHALEAGIPAWNDAMLAVRKCDRLAAIDRGVKLRAIGEIAGVVDRVKLAFLRQWSCTYLCVNVIQRVGSLFPSQRPPQFGANHRRCIVKMSVGRVRERVKSFRARRSWRKRWDLRRKLRNLDATGGCGMVCCCRGVVG